MNKLLVLSFVFSSMALAQKKPDPLNIKVKEGDKKFNSGTTKPGATPAPTGTAGSGSVPYWKDPNNPGYDKKCGFNPNENPDENPWQNSTVVLTAPPATPRGRICVHYTKKTYKGQSCGFRKYYYINFTTAQLTNLVSSSMEKGYMGNGGTGGRLDWSVVSNKVVGQVDTYLKTHRPKLMEDCRTNGWIKPPAFSSNWPICRELGFGDHVLGYNVQLTLTQEQKAKQTSCTKYASTFLQRPIRVTNTQMMSIVMQADSVNGTGFSNVRFDMQYHDEATRQPVGPVQTKNLTGFGSVSFDISQMTSNQWFVINSDFIAQAIASGGGATAASKAAAMKALIDSTTTANGSGYGTFLVRAPDAPTANLAPDTITKCGLEEPTEDEMAKAVTAAGGKCVF